MHAFRLTSATLLLAGLSSLYADDALPGHSAHGEAFNEGPRQAAVLIPGTGKIDFPITTTKPEARKFFLQGVGQLHGFWYYEAERSFRQVALLDKDCAMAYWGMAMANVNTEKRAKEFIKKAAALKAKANAREKLWIGSLETFYKEDKRDKKQRALDMIRDLETLVQDYPDDVEAKAFLAWKIWQARDDAPMSSTQAVDALLDQVFAADPNHPAHHYRIHIWDSAGKPARALKSAAVLGQTAPGVAHMWHMPGHTFSKLRRFDDAAWQQEASTRVDHAYMIKSFVLPDQIHNYAHNEEWLVRTYNELGRAHDGIALAKSLIAIPRHPKYNSLDKTNTSAGYGRTRLLESLQKWELWEELLKETEGPLLGPVDQIPFAAARLRAIGVAHYELNNAKALAADIQALEALEKKEAAKTEPKTAAKSVPAKTTTKTETAQADPKAEPAETIRKAEPAKTMAKTPPTKPTNPKADTKTADNAKKPEPKPLPAALAELRALQAILTKSKEATQLLEAAKDLSKERQARLWLALGDKKKAEELIKNFGQDLTALVAKVDVLTALGKTEEAKKAFAEIRKASFDLDDDLPVTKRLDKLAVSFGIKEPWRNAPPKRTDSGNRPPLESLGPVHWHSPTSPAWEAVTLEGKPVSSDQLLGKPTLLLFYLGSTCTHCMSQINAFAKVAPDFEKAGIQLAGVTLEPLSTAGQIKDQMDTKKAPPFPIYCDPSLAAFKTFRAYDDFEEQALHAAVLIDAKGKLRWLDVSWDPFTDTKFILEEATRLMKLPQVEPGT